MKVSIAEVHAVMQPPTWDISGTVWREEDGRTSLLCPPSRAAKREDPAADAPALVCVPALWMRYPDLEDAIAPLPHAHKAGRRTVSLRLSCPEIGFGEDAPVLFWVGVIEVRGGPSWLPKADSPSF